MDHRARRKARAADDDPGPSTSAVAPSKDGSATVRRARRSFWGLVIVAALATGSLSVALKGHPGPSTGLQVAISGIVLVTTIALAARVMIALEQARRGAREAIHREADGGGQP